MIKVGKLMRLHACSCVRAGHLKTSPSTSAISHSQKHTGPPSHQLWRSDQRRHIFHQAPSFKTPEKRSDLSEQKRVVVKLGSAVITREDECGLALGRFASIVEQVAELQKQKKEVLIVTSGAVAFGKQRLRQESLMALSLRQNLSHLSTGQPRHDVEPRACAAAGQNGLMYMYDTMFQQYGFKTAQMLVNKKHFENEFSRQNLKSTLAHLCAFNIIPIINTNDAMAPPPEPNKDLAGVISIEDNDSLAARLAVEIEAGLLIIMSDVNGLYTAPPGSPDARLLSTYSPNSTSNSSIIFGNKSRVGLGGMDSKVKAATWAVNNGTSVVICNGCEENALLNIMKGRKVGTFFTMASSPGDPMEVQAHQARDGAWKLQTLTSEDRAAIINRLADLVLERKTSIISANQLDLDHAHDAGMSQSVLGRLKLDEEKLETLSAELRQTAARFCGVQGQVLKSRSIAQNMEMRQITAPIGVLLVISESQPDTLLQMAALSICSGNGMLMRGGKETWHTDQILHTLIQQALEPFAPPQTVGLVGHHEDILDLLQMHQHIDLVVPRGSSALVNYVKNNTQRIPVLGHSEGVCHVYVDEDADPEMAVRVVVDSKCQSPDAINTMGTLLIHKKHRQGPLFDQICEQLQHENVEFTPGPQLSKLLKFSPLPGASLKTEYGALQCTVEVVDSVDQAIQHINMHGSGYTESIVTNDDDNAEKFLQLVNSANVFLNTSTRFSDGSLLGQGTVMGIKNSQAHSRGCVDIESLLTTKWVMRGRGQVMCDLINATLQCSHQTLLAEDESDANNITTRSSRVSEAYDTMAQSSISEADDMEIDDMLVHSSDTKEMDDITDQSSSCSSDEDSDFENAEKL